MATQNKKSRLDGLFQTTRSSKDKPVQTRNQNVKFVPISSGSPNNKGVVEFEYTAGINEWFRLAPAPFFVDYQINLKNPQKVADPTPAEDGTIDWKKDPPTIDVGNISVTKDYLYTSKVQVMSQTVTKGHGFYLPPEMGFGCFYTHVEVFIDGMKIGDESDMMNQNKVYQQFNRIYATNEVREKVNQVVVEKNIADRTTNRTVSVKKKEDGTYTTEVKKTRSPTQLLLGRTTATETYEIGTFKLTDRFTLDGNFAVSPPFCNALSTLRGTQDLNENGFLPPGTTIMIRLHKKSPLFSMLQIFDLDFDDLYEKNSLTADENEQIHKEGAFLQILNLALMIESKTLPDMVSNKQLTRTLNYPFNRVQMDICNVEQGHQHLTMRSRVPAGSKAAFVTFMKEEHLWFNSNSKKTQCNFFHFPQNLNNLNFSLTDHGTILNKEGLNDISKYRRNYSADLQNYYTASISGKNLTDITFDEMFPRASNPLLEPLTQSIFINLQDYYIEESTRLEIESHYIGSLSPTNTKMIVCYVLDYNLKRTPNGKWVLEAIL